MDSVTLEQRVSVLERQVLSLRRQLKQQDSWLDTICSPPWKRVWWLLRGWRFYRLGRWY